MPLRDVEIEGRLGAEPGPYRLAISPFRADCLQGSSYDLHLGTVIQVLKPDVYIVDPDNPGEYMEPLDTDGRGLYYLDHGEFILAETLEYVEIPEDIRGVLHGKSSLGRLGLGIHRAGYIDAGFTGTITLELINDLRVPVKLTPGMRIAQISFDQLTGRVRRPYGHPDLRSRYQGQRGPTPARAVPDRLPLGLDRTVSRGQAFGLRMPRERGDYYNLTEDERRL